MARFETTSWSLVLDAQSDDSVAARFAMARLYERYWYPLYAFLRKKGYSTEDAQDLTQEFFARCLEKDVIAQARKERGKFRTFLLTCFTRFVAGERDKAHAQKRGGAQPRLSLDIDFAEQRIRLDDSAGISVEESFDRNWALGILDIALRQLEADQNTGKNQDRFAELKPYLLPGVEVDSYESLGKRLGSSPDAAKVAVHRMRQKFRDKIRAEVAAGLPSDGDVNDEIRYMVKLLRRAQPNLAQR